MSCDLAIIIPVFNEEASVKKVVLEWFKEIENWTEKFVILCLDDGSTDNTPAILQSMRGCLGSRLEVRSHPNRGHGQTCLAGYRAVCERGIPHVLQIDSDGQCDPQYFFRFWRMRNEFEVIYGVRRARDDGWRRVVASFILKASLLAGQQVYCPDANVPYRLLQTKRLAAALDAIPPTFFLANVALAVLLRRSKWTHAYVPIRFRARYGGEPSVRVSEFGARALQLHRQLLWMRG